MKDFGAPVAPVAQSLATVTVVVTIVIIVIIVIITAMPMPLVFPGASVLTCKL